jgi:hypothetical protein
VPLVCKSCCTSAPTSLCVKFENLCTGLSHTYVIPPIPVTVTDSGSTVVGTCTTTNDGDGNANCCVTLPSTGTYTVSYPGGSQSVSVGSGGANITVTLSTLGTWGPIAIHGAYTCLGVCCQPSTACPVTVTVGGAVGFSLTFTSGISEVYYYYMPGSSGGAITVAWSAPGHQTLTGTVGVTSFPLMPCSLLSGVIPYAGATGDCTSQSWGPVDLAQVGYDAGGPAYTQNFCWPIDACWEYLVPVTLNVTIPNVGIYGLDRGTTVTVPYTSAGEWSIVLPADPAIGCSGGTLTVGYSTVDPVDPCTRAFSKTYASAGFVGNPGCGSAPGAVTNSASICPVSGSVSFGGGYGTITWTE